MTPPVDKQHGLMALVQTTVQLRGQTGTEDRAIAPLKLPPHIHDLHLGQRPALHPLAQLNQLQAVFRTHPRHGPHISGNRRRRAAQHQHRAVLGGPLPGHLPGVVAGTSVGLVGGLMLLVHHDYADVLQRRKYGASGPDHHPGFTGADAPPFVVALARRQRRMQHRRVAAEAPVQPGHHLGRQRDFRHQHDGRAPQLQRLPDQANIDLSLSTAGDAVKQKPTAAVF